MMRLILLLIICSLWGFSCNQNKTAQKFNVDTKEVVISSFKRSVSFTVEVADTDLKRSQGLMYRRYLGDNEGMLFIFDQQAIHPFWMKNTYIPLDIIFFAQDFTVVGVIKNTKPLSLERLSIDAPAKYALEVKAGTIKRFAIGIGHKARFAL